MQQNIQTTLAKLVSIPSVSTDSRACHDALAFVQSELQDIALFTYSATDTPHPWMIATTQDTRTPDILLAAHLDVVPAPDDMFTVQERNGNLYGRGVYDMKFAASCYIELLKAHATQLPQLNIGFLFTTDEEVNGSCMNAIMEWGLRPDVILLPDGGDNWIVEKRAKGIYSVELTAHGKTAHGSRPGDGVNALHTILDVVQTLRSRYPSDTPAGSTLAATVLHSGKALNQIPDLASTMLDFRSFDKQAIAEYSQLIASQVDAHELDLRVVNHGDPVIFDASHPAVQPFLQILQEQTGHDVQYCDSYGTTDARYLARYNIPCIVVEPNGGGRHSDSEWIKTTDLEKFYRLIERWVIG